MAVPLYYTAKHVHRHSYKKCYKKWVICGFSKLHTALAIHYKMSKLIGHAMRDYFGIINLRIHTNSRKFGGSLCPISDAPGYSFAKT